MRCFVVTALVVFAAVFCIDGNKASEVKSVEKRQVPLPPDGNQETCSDIELQRRNDSLRCSNASIGQQLLDVFAGCGYNDEALRKEQECVNNDAMEGFCYELQFFSNFTALINLAQTVVGRCSGLRLGTFCRFSCSDSVRELRDHAGCCTNYLITSAAILSQQSTIPNLFSKCGVQSPPKARMEWSVHSKR